MNRSTRSILTLLCPAWCALSLACGPDTFFVESGSYTAESPTASQFMNLTAVVNAEQKTATLTPAGGQPITLTLGQEVVVEFHTNFTVLKAHELEVTPDPLTVNGATLVHPMLTPGLTRIRQLTLFEGAPDGRAAAGGISIQFRGDGQ